MNDAGKKRCLVIVALFLASSICGQVEDDREAEPGKYKINIDDKVEPGKMRAILLHNFGMPEIFHLTQIPIPTAAYNQLLIKVEAVGLNTIDAYIRCGMFPNIIELPTILGKEISGVIEHVNASSSKFKKGDKVFCGINGGGYAEYAVAEIKNCYNLPERMNFSQGAAIHTSYFTAYRALFGKAKLKKGEAVLMYEGSGSIQTAAIQLVKHVGAYIVASLENADNKRFLSKLGADFVVLNSSDDQVLYNVLNQTSLNMPGFDVIFERFDNNYVDEERDRRFLKENGRIVVIGNSVPNDMVETTPEPNPKPLYPVSLYQYTKEEQQEAASFILANMEWDVLSPVIGQEYKFEEVNQAHHHLSRPDKVCGKIVLVP